MALEIDIKEDIHLQQLDNCPGPVQADFRDAFEELQQASIAEVKQEAFVFLESVDGHKEYNIVSTAADEKYIVALETKETPPDTLHKIRILRIGRSTDMIE